MAFLESIRKQEVAKAERCATCRDPFPDDAYIEVHSATSLHLVLDKNSDTKYKVTNTPMGFKRLRGKTISSKAFFYEDEDGERKQNDAFCLCIICHDEIKRISLAEARLRNPKFKGNTPPPGILEEVTLFFVNRGRPMVHDIVNDSTET